jgi:arylsulfatase A-like enzyme
MVLTDDQEPDSVRLMPEVLQNVGATGVTFSNAYASVPECCPSRVSLLTGQYAHNHGVISNSPPDGGYSAFGADANTLPVWLHDAGYRTGYVGKYLNGYGFEALGNDPTDIPPGWSYWAALTRHTEYQMYGYTINQNGSLDAYGDRPSDYQTDVLADKAAGFMERSARAGSPFYLTVAPLAPHDEGVLEDLDVPRNPRPAPRHEGRFASRGLPHGPAFDEADVSDKPRFVKSDPRLAEEELADLERLYRSRAESLLAVDDMVRELIATLRREGELDDTLFVFTSDNGYLLGEHRQVGKKKVYEESAGVPLAIRGPGFSGGASVEQPVSNVDLVATIVEMTGVEPGLELDGVSLAPLARGESETRPPVLIEVPTSGGFAAVRTRRFVLAEHEKGATELFDLERDPAQLENVRQVSRYKPARTRLSRKLSELRECAGASCR